MADINVSRDGDNFTVQPNGNASIALATAGTYVDKNIVFNIEGLQVAVETVSGKNVLTFSNYGT